jgi:membrane protein DedA with SNARE-associated domain
MFKLISALLEHYGLWGVFGMMLVENLVPIIPSELILPLAGFEAARGHVDTTAAIFVATLGSTIGGTAWYGIGYGLGIDRLRQLVRRSRGWIPISVPELDLSEAWFKRWGSVAVAIGRTLPGVRGVICVPPGLARMHLGAFLASSAVGAGLWSALLIGLGYWLNARYALIGAWLSPIADVFFLGVAGIYGLRVVRGWRRGPSE